MARSVILVGSAALSIGVASATVYLQVTGTLSA
jgi:hypothetical protein